MSSTNPDSRPLPDGWITQYDDNYKAWFYVDTKANPPTPSWTHPLGPPPATPSHSESHGPNKQSPYGTVNSGGPGSYAAATPTEPKNPDTRPLPVGWVAQYDENHKAWFYVDTNANPPTPSWVHPLGPPPTSPSHSQSGEPENPDKRPLPTGWIQQYDSNGPATSPAPASTKAASSPLAQPVAPGEPENPDKRPLPTGWIQQYDPSHKAFFYVDTKAPNPTPTWTHPLGPPPTSPGPYSASGTTPSAPSKAASPPPPAATPGQPENPDKRPLPTGWIQQYDSSHKAFFYVDTTAPNPAPTWVHPLGPPTASPAPGTHGSSPASPAPSNPGQPTNPDKRPLPAGWIDQYDPNHKAWFYVDTNAPNPSPTWVHPLGPPPTSPTPTTTSTSAPVATPSTTGPQNPDTRTLPPGWMQQYDATHNTWFYVDTTKTPPVTTWTHPLGPAPPGAQNPLPSPGGYGSPAPTTPYGQPAYAGAPQQKPGKDPLSGLLGGSAGKMVGGLLGGKAGKYLGGSSGGGSHGSGGKHGGGALGQVAGLAGKFLGGKDSHGSSSHGSGYGQPQQAYGAPPPGQYGLPAPQQGYGAPPPGQTPYGAPPPGHSPYGAPPPQQGYGQPHGGGHGSTLPGGIKVPGELGSLVGKFGGLGKH